MKQNRGITLFTLIITIIVMLILTGVSINLTFGDNGAITRSESTKMENLRVQILDKIQNETKTAVNEFGDYDQQEAINNIIKNNDGAKIKELIVETNGRLGISFEEQGHIFRYFVSNKGEVKSVSEYVYEKENSIYAIKSKIGGVEKSAYDLLAPVPMGFIVKNEIDNKIENGLVIVEKNTSNEYVWIPVKEEDLNSLLVADRNGNLYYHEIIKIEEEEKYKIVEPYFVSTEQEVNINNLKLEVKEFNMLLRKKFNDSIKSVKNNSGFYISKEKLNIDNEWINIWSKQNDLKNKYNENEKIFTGMIYGFQLKLLGYLVETNNFIVTQSALLEIGGENSEFKYANMKINTDDYIEINNTATELETYTILYFE